MCLIIYIHLALYRVWGTGILDPDPGVPGSYDPPRFVVKVPEVNHDSGKYDPRILYDHRILETGIVGIWKLGS